MRPYEAMVILDPNIEDEEANDALISRLTKVVTDGGGEIANIDKWGKRRLAYEVNGYTEGFYVLIHFKAENAAVRELERIMKITDNVVRYLLVRQEDEEE